MKKTPRKTRQTAVKLRDPEHELRYPEEAIIDALSGDAPHSSREGQEFADLFRAVTGRAGRTSNRSD